MALRARSSERASISSATLNRNITMAASGHWPISTAPVTAMLIRALMLRLPLRTAIQPFWVSRPQAVMAATASAAVT